MVESRFPDDVRKLVQDHLRSMAHLDALVALVGAPDASLLAAEIAARISVRPELAAQALSDLEAAGLASSDASADGARYRFAPRDAELRRAALMLAEMYRRFPVQVIRAVYEQRPSPVRPAADRSG